MLLITDSKHKVVEDTVFDILKFSMDESLRQEEADEGGLVVGIPQGSQALQDACDAQVVMSVTVNEKR